MTEKLAESALLRLVSRWFIVAMGGAIVWMVTLLIEIDKRDSVADQRINHIIETLDDMAVAMEVRVENIYKRIDEKTAARYTSADAQTDKAKQAAIDNIQNATLERILKRIEVLESNKREYSIPPYYNPK
jgi:hypothetical protein